MLWNAFFRRASYTAFLISALVYTQQLGAAVPEPTPAQTISQEVLCPQGTFMVARLKGFDVLSTAVERSKSWLHDHPSIESLLDEDTWKKIEKFDLQRAAAEGLDLGEDKFKDYFSGSISICFSNDFKDTQKTKTLPAVVMMTSKTEEKAGEFIQMVRENTDVVNVSRETEGVDHFRVKASDKTDKVSPLKKDAISQPKQSKTPELVDVYVTLYQNKILMGNTLDYTLLARKALENQTSRQPVFFEQAANADLALWVDPRPIFALAQSQLEAKAKAAEEKGESSKIDPKIIDKLGLDEIQGAGVAVDFSQSSLRIEVDTVPEPSGVAKLFTCSPQGIVASPLIPADAEEFTISRFDAVCLWEQLKKLAKIIVPATDTMYQGWKKQIQETYGVDFDKQLFGSLGDRAILYTTASGEKSDSLALYVAVNDPISLTGALDAISGFFTQGKALFEKSQIAGTPVWRLKNEFQSANTQSVAYAITHDWLIVSVGDPTQMQDLIEGADNHQIDNKTFKNDIVNEIMKDPTLVSFSHRPLKEILTDIAMIIKETHRKTVSPKSEEPDEDIPEFDDVKESMLIYTRYSSGVVETNLRIIPNEK